MAFIRRSMGKLLIAILGAVIGIILQPYFEELQISLSAPRETFRIPISAKLDELEALAGFKYILVRFGSDEFLGRPSTGSGQREAGKLRLRYGSVAVAKADGGDAAVLVFTLPIHGELGTQFKLFAVQKSPDGIAKLKQVLEGCCTEEITITAADLELWFLLKREKYKRFAVEPTADGKILNNLVMPPHAR